MTIEEFMDRFQIRKKKTVSDWINKGLIPGVTTDSRSGAFIIPEPAWPPYTGARAKRKNADAIYKSIVKACGLRRRVCASLYHMDDAEFQSYIDNLEKAELISVKWHDGIPYYYATPKSKELLSSSSPAGLIKSISEAAAKGVTAALLETALV